MRNIQDKKGMSIGDMYPAVLTILLVGIVLGVGLYILGSFHSQVTPSRTGTQTGINTTAGTTTLNDAALAEFNMTTIAVVNWTDGASVTNFTYTSAGVITWGADVIGWGEIDKVNASYTYTYDATDSAAEAVTTTTTGLATFADWIAIIVVVIAAAIVLGIVLTSFGRRRNTI